MAERMLAHFALQHHRRAVTFTADAKSALRGYSWPGNVRELRNVVERAAILCQSPHVGVEHLLLSPNLIAGRRVASIGDPIPMEKVEEMHIKAVLASTPSIEKACQVLGMDSVTLWRRRKKYEMSEAEAHK